MIFMILKVDFQVVYQLTFIAYRNINVRQAKGSCLSSLGLLLGHIHTETPLLCYTTLYHTLHYHSDILFGCIQ